MIAGVEVQPEPLKRPRVVGGHWPELRAFGWNIVEVATAGDAIEILQTTIQLDMVINDVNTPGRPNGFGLTAFVARERSRSSLCRERSAARLRWAPL